MNYCRKFQFCRIFMHRLKLEQWYKSTGLCYEVVTFEMPSSQGWGWF